LSLRRHRFELLLVARIASAVFASRPSRDRGSVVDNPNKVPKFVVLEEKAVFPRKSLLPFVGTLLLTLAAVPASAQQKGVMLMNRIGPTSSELFIASADGSAARPFLQTASGFEYNPSFSDDGKYIIFTSEQNGLGQADIYRADIDGTNIDRLTDDPAVDDQGALSPDDSTLAFVSTRDTHKANIWLLDMKTRKVRNLTGAADVQGDEGKPDGFFRPAWSPDGKWIAFTSQRGGFDLFLVRSQGGVAMPLTSGEDPTWAPNSRTIIFCKGPDHGKVLSLLDVPTKQFKDIARILESNSQPSWAP